jgi:hypothetical protein
VNRGVSLCRAPFERRYLSYPAGVPAALELRAQEGGHDRVGLLRAQP